MTETETSRRHFKSHLENDLRDRDVQVTTETDTLVIRPKYYKTIVLVVDIDSTI